MAAVETKVPGYFTDKMTIGDGTDDADGFGTKTLVLKVCVRAEGEKGSEREMERRPGVTTHMRGRPAINTPRQRPYRAR